MHVDAARFAAQSTEGEHKMRSVRFDTEREGKIEDTSRADGRLMDLRPRNKDPVNKQCRMPSRKAQRELLSDCVDQVIILRNMVHSMVSPEGRKR